MEKIIQTHALSDIDQTIFSFSFQVRRTPFAQWQVLSLFVHFSF